MNTEFNSDSNSSLNQWGSSVQTLGKTCLAVFLLIAEKYQTYTPSEMAKKLKISPQTVTYSTKRLTGAGLIRERFRSNIVNYDLTPEGESFLTSISLTEVPEKFQKLLTFRLHNCCYLVPIMSNKDELFAKLAEDRTWVSYGPKTWQQKGYKKSLHGSFVRFTPQSVVFHIPDVYASSPLSAETIAMQKALKLKEELESTYDIRLGAPDCRDLTQISETHVAIMSKAFRKLEKRLGNFRGDVIDIDRSKQELEIELKGSESSELAENLASFLLDVAKSGFRLQDILDIASRTSTDEEPLPPTLKQGGVSNE